MSNHPECKDGEVFLTNTDGENYHLIGWKTKRMGNVAFDYKGNALKYSRPVFVQASELKAAGIDPNSIKVYGKLT